MADVSASPRHYGKVADGARAGLGEGIPQVPKLRSRSLKAFGAIEVARHQFLPGEIQTLPFKGPVINLHLSAPHRLVQRQHDLTRDGLVATNDAAVTPAGVPGSSLGRGSGRKLGSEGGFSKRGLEQATDYINDNLSRKLTLAEIAGVAHMSPDHFARSFKAATGLSPHQYVIHRRVERAKSLLLDTGLTVAEVARGLASPTRATSPAT